MEIQFKYETTEESKWVTDNYLQHLDDLLQRNFSDWDNLIGDIKERINAADTSTLLNIQNELLLIKECLELTSNEMKAQLCLAKGTQFYFEEKDTTIFPMGYTYQPEHFEMCIDTLKDILEQLKGFEKDYLDCVTRTDLRQRSLDNKLSS